MLASPMTRLAALITLAAFVIAPAVAVRSAHAQPGVRFRDIVVDVAPLRAWVGDPTAAWVQQTLPGALAQALAGHMATGDRGGATLVVRIDYIYLGPSSGGTGPAHASQDTIEGALTVRGPLGGIASDIPLRAITSYYITPVDGALVEQGYYWRVVALAQAFAGWAPRELGL